MSTTTFLFTDIEGSTRLWEAHPEAMEKALAVHDELLADEVQGRGGRIFKHTGDGVAAAFSSARAALEAAAEIQRRRAAVDQPEPGPLRIRIGIHSGEIEERDGDFFGPVLNRTARLMDAAHGGQTLVSLVTERLAETEDLVLRDLGEHRLRDLTQPERIFELVVDGVTDDFPPLRTLDAASHNLPTLPTSFIGRGQELAEVMKLIRAARLVTITGVGGSGKTRVALHAAADLLPEFPDGAWLVELAAVSDPDLLDAALVESLGVAQPQGVTLRRAALDHLAGRTALLLMDNCEHLIDAAADLIGEMLAAAPEVTMVATSRELLAIPGEVSYGLRSMGLPPREAEGAAARSSDAVRLFVDRASAARPDFRLTADNLGPVAEICRRLDGMPLAIELAAARLRSFTPTEIAQHLDQRFRLLTGGSRTAVPRQQTLTAAIEWSYRLLDDTERALFQRLSVFQGGFTFEAACAVCTGDPIDEPDLLALLPQLVDKSLLVADEAHGEVRYRLLETLRQFARDRLSEDGEPDQWRRRHAAYYRGLAEQTRTVLYGPERTGWTRRLTAELDNFRQAMTWSIDSGDPATAVAVATGFLRIMLFDGRWSEAVSWFEQILDAAGDDLPDPLRADALLGLGTALSASAEQDRAVELLESSVRLYRQLEAQGADVDLFFGLPRALNNLALRLLHQGRAGDHNEIYTALVTEALEAARRIGDRYVEAVMLANLAHHRDPDGDPEEARLLFAEAQRVAEEIDSINRLADLSSQRAHFEFDQGEFEEARAQWEASVRYADEAQLAVTWLQSRVGLAACEVELGNASAAVRYAEAVRAIVEKPELAQRLELYQMSLALGAGVDAALGRFERVAVAAGASEAVHDRGIAVRWDLVPYFERTKAVARETLGDDVFAEARRRGASMTPEDVAEFLLAA